MSLKFNFKRSAFKSVVSNAGKSDLPLRCLVSCSTYMDFLSDCSLLSLTHLIYANRRLPTDLVATRVPSYTITYALELRTINISVKKGEWGPGVGVMFWLDSTGLCSLLKDAGLNF